MTALAIVMLQEIRAGFPVVGGQEVDVDGKSAVFIARAARQLRVDLILGNENAVVFPREAFPGLKGYPWFCERLKGIRHAGGIVIVKAHHIPILRIDHREIAEPGHQPFHILLMVEEAGHLLHLFGKTALEHLQFSFIEQGVPVIVHDVPLHERQRVCVLRQRVASGGVQHRLGCVLALAKKLVDSARHIIPGEERLFYHLIPHGMAHCDLQAQLVKPNGVVGAVDDKALAALAILTLDIGRGRLRGLFDHIVVDQSQLAAPAIAARAQYLVHHLRGHGDLTLIGRSHAFLYGADLPVDGGQFRQRKGRGDSRLCCIQILFGCLVV